MCTVVPRKICNTLDITHQAHFTGNLKIWILCHMCAYQHYIIIFGFSHAMKLCHTIILSILVCFEGSIKARIFLFDFSEFQRFQNMLDFTYKFSNLDKTLCCDFTNNLTSGNTNSYTIVLFLNAHSDFSAGD